MADTVKVELEPWLLAAIAMAGLVIVELDPWLSGAGFLEGLTSARKSRF